MNLHIFLGVNGALQAARPERRFQLPGRERTLHSLRFGRHGYSAGHTLQILPIGGGEPAAGLAARNNGR